jgi:phosphoribosylanthranilate isomerase
MTKIKICGLSRPQDIDAVNEALPDYIGFVFAASPRRVSHLKAKELRGKLDSRIHAVGVFVNAPQEEIFKLLDEGVIDVVQLHGDEDEAYIKTLKSQTNCPVIKSVRMQSPQQAIDAENLPCDFLLLDTFQKEVVGGTGKQFEWSLIPSLSKPFFLAGGLNAYNLAEAIHFNPYCLDISSGAETNGMKDPDKIKQLVQMVRRQQQ